MELLKEISERDIGLKGRAVKYRVRRAARAVLFDNENKVALLYIARRGYHKIPGGDVKSDEDIKLTLQRELTEETGCVADIKDGVGIIVEYRDKFEQIQFSYCYIARVEKDSRKQYFTGMERSKGFQLEWVDLDEAIRLMQNDTPKDYDGKFIVKRDVIFLKRAKELLL